MLIGYARALTQDQNLAIQTDALTQAGCDKIFNDKTSGSRAERPDSQMHWRSCGKVTPWSYGS